MMKSVFCISDDSFVVGTSFELLFNIRPRSPTGLLLHVGDSSRNQYGPAMGHYLTVYMLKGEVKPFCQFDDAISAVFFLFFFYFSGLVLGTLPVQNKFYI